MSIFVRFERAAPLFGTGSQDEWLLVGPLDWAEIEHDTLRAEAENGEVRCESLSYRTQMLLTTSGDVPYWVAVWTAPNGKKYSTMVIISEDIDYGKTLDAMTLRACIA